jgi:glyoxylase-like metal-dependent hydrolase (beta-lactamase superfamily II)
MSFEVIDTRYKGIENVIACHRLGDVLIDPGPSISINHVIEQLGDVVPRVVLLTHVHLDHAGGTGHLVERFPELQVYVHEIGAPHMIDPARLVASTSRTFGDADAAWGETHPVPAANVHTIADGDVIEGFEAIHTPGHSAHHMAFFHLETELALVGDLAGQAVPPETYVLVSTPPPEVDLDAWTLSIDKVAERFPSTLGLTHFGRVTDVIGQFERAKAQLRACAEIARDGTEADYVAFIETGLESVTPAVAEALFDALPPLDQNYAGLVRYWSKKAEADRGNQLA